MLSHKQVNNSFYMVLKLREIFLGQEGVAFLVLKFL